MSKWYIAAFLALAACGADRGAPTQQPSEQPEAPPPEAGSQQASFGTLDAPTLKRRLDEGWDPFVLDVRTHEEVMARSLPFTDRVEPHETVARIASELPRDRDIVVFCASGRRSALAARTLMEAGIDPARLHSLDGGIKSWLELVEAAED